ncbi:MAG: PepSY domain-containing protein [Rhodobacter sp.]|uniref:PepSY domain-containing protein n=1 Tax=Pararhodobacter sp. TaxID=2127056 RepID=UPI001DFC4D46|nr:PepSY domain-containing protein [Pararhodobacter sp.]MCB1346848.1 PepSY domain-containing protein [Paracoccaceae bacterium]MCC0072715.1 PepSY domain-containing protein [Rhodobacter sp.]HPD90960.1 PepSY domain-containing protein [Pararhodobacter sp.]
MIRAIHRWPGLLALALITLLALSGAVLSVFPAADALSSPQAEAGLSAATLVQRVEQAIPTVEQIRRAPSGRITAYWFDNGTPHAAVIDPATGQAAGSADPNAFERWMVDLHRSLFLGDGGRWAMAAGALAMLVLTLSGAMMVARRTGGWRRWLAPLRGPLAGRLHVELARVAVPGLMLSSATALWMTASTFGYLPDEGMDPPFPATVSGQTGFDPATAPLLAQTPVSDFRQLSWPYPGDATDVFAVKTAQGSGYLDQGNGSALGWADRTGWQRVSDTIVMLHTGQGAALIGLALGLMALAVPLMGVTGFIVWLTGRRGRPRIKHNLAAGKAGTVLLVGSEGGSTWGFAATLHRALTEAGHGVHTGALSSFDPARYPHAERFVILAATYGDGDAPSSAKGFLSALDRAPHAPVAVLGFGDRSFPAYCAFARAIETRAQTLGWQALIPFDTVDRQSPQDFARWGRALGEALGHPLELAHHPVRPVTQDLVLVSRRDYGAEVQAPTAILRFALPRMSLWQRLARRGLAGFAAGDLIGILPRGSEVPRFYSLASSRHDGFVEIVVRKHSGGLCSGQLMALEPGQSIAAFLRPNPGFRPAGKPLILIGAGTGIGPLAGFIRGNGKRRPVHLFFGMRHADSDFLYAEDLATWHADGRLSALTTAASRGDRPHYVQDALRNEAGQVARMIRDGARVMVCGGRGMAAGVTEALAEILEPWGLTPAMLKAEGRYVEDTY